MTLDEANRRANTRRIMWLYHGIARYPDGSCDLGGCLVVSHDERRGLIVAACLDKVVLIAVPARRVLDPMYGDHPWERDDGGMRLLPTEEGVKFARTVVEFVEFMEMAKDLGGWGERIDLDAARAVARKAASSPLDLWFDVSPPDEQEAP